MRSATLAATLLTTIALPLAASATTVYSFTITGDDINNIPYQIAFSLDPDTIGAIPHVDYIDNKVVGTVNSVPVLFYVLFNAEDAEYGDELDLDDSDNGSNSGSFTQGFIIDPNGATPLFSGIPYTGPINFNLGTYTGYSWRDCAISLRAPLPGSAAMPTLALLQVPVIATSCDEPITISATSSNSTPIPPIPPTTVTPEPASLALFGTGALGLFSLARRRFTH